MVAKTIPPPLEQASAPNWTAIEQSQEFRALVSAKARFVVPATAFFIVFYFALPILNGYFPTLMGTDVGGHITIAYLFALAQFVMTWGLMALYVRAAKNFDAREHQIVDDVKRGKLG